VTAALPAWATLPPHDPSLTRVLAGNWWRAPGGSEEPDAVLVYATEPDPETGLIWLWQTRSGLRGGGESLQRAEISGYYAARRQR
jgi:hypothetical protein